MFIKNTKMNKNLEPSIYNLLKLTSTSKMHNTWVVVEKFTATSLEKRMLVSRYLWKTTITEAFSSTNTQLQVPMNLILLCLNHLLIPLASLKLSCLSWQLSFGSKYLWQAFFSKLLPQMGCHGSVARRKISKMKHT